MIGASITGLLAARVLADYYDQVTVLERDTFPPPGENRKGVPQGKHIHVLLPRGQQGIEALCPGFTEDLLSQGVVQSDIDDVRWCMEDGYANPEPAGLVILGVTRPLLEATLRSHVVALPNITIIENCDVLGPTATADKQQITGLQVVRRSEGKEAQTMAADLVIDASGRGSRTPAWLQELGYEAPEEEVVRVGITYATRLYRRRLDQLNGMSGVMIPATARVPRGGALAAQEGDRWMLTLFGYFEHQPPRDEAGYLAYAKSLVAPDIYNWMQEVEPISDIQVTKFPANQRRHYEGLSRFPGGFLVMGDAVCSFNPIYAQGISVSVMQAAVLQQCLAEGDERSAGRFFQASAKVIDTPWMMAIGGDLQIPAVEGARTVQSKLMNWYIGKIQRACQNEAALFSTFQRVAALLAPPQSIMHPRVIWQTIRGNLRPPRLTPPTPTAAVPTTSTPSSLSQKTA